MLGGRPSSKAGTGVLPVADNRQKSSASKPKDEGEEGPAKCWVWKIFFDGQLQLESRVLP